MENTYKANLEALYNVNRELYNQLVCVEANSKFDLFMGEKAGDVNLLENATKLTIYSDPNFDLQMKLKELEPLYKHPFLFFFGLGNGFLFSSLLGNKKFVNLIVVEPEIEIIYIALHLNNFVDAIRSLRLIIIHADDFGASTAMSLTKLSGLGVYVKLYNLLITADFYAKYTNKIEQVNSTMVDAIIQSVKNHGNDLEDSLIGVDHFLDNTYMMVENIAYKELIKQKNSEVAVMVATGPSLTKQLPLLKEIQNSVTIFCVDASLPILEKWEIVPDVVSSLERIALTSKFFKNTTKEFQEKVGCFALSAVQHREVTSSVLGKKCIIMRPFGYMLAFGLDDYGYAGIGMSAANFNYEIAYMMGYKTLVLIGQDLAYSEDEKSSHASDHIFGTMESQLEKKRVEDNPIMLPKWGGAGEIRSNDIWVLFRNYFIQYITDTQNNATTIDATEGGAHIDGAIDMSFAEVVEKYVDRNLVKKQISVKTPDQEEIEKHKKQIDKVLKDMIVETEILLTDMDKIQKDILGFAQKIENLNRADQLKIINVKKMDKLITKIDALKNRILDDKLRKYFWESIRGQVVNLELNIAKFAVAIPKNIDEQNEIKIEYIFAHRFWIFSVINAITAHKRILLKYVGIVAE